MSSGVGGCGVFVAFGKACVATSQGLAAVVVAANGGAPGPTLDMLDAAEAQTDLESWLEVRLRLGEHLMGFGHRVFHGNNPRAEAMRRSMQGMGPHVGRLACRLA
jgi:citrate synthase